MFEAFIIGGVVGIILAEIYDAFRKPIYPSMEMGEIPVPFVYGKTQIHKSVVIEAEISKGKSE